ncbi:MAG: glycoside hydrolase family 2 TIM barrel-domain containing protein, partial [Patescibacteria group bacterium]
IPSWAKDISEQEQQRAVLELVSRTVTRYKDKQNIIMWQLENEPLLTFGICPEADRAFLTQEQNLIRSTDTSRPILITDSGELNSWLDASQYGDMLGTTMYRTVFSGRTKKLFHYDYLFPSWAYRLKSRYVGLLRNKSVLISELQGEPWGSRPFPEMSPSERNASFSPERFLQLAKFAKRTQLTPAYWWGVEYWYWEKIRHNNSAYVDIAKQLFSSEGGDLYGK